MAANGKSLAGFKQYFQGSLYASSLVCAWVPCRHKKLQWIPKLAGLPRPWGRVRLGRAGEASRAAGASMAVASGMGSTLSWCCSTCPERTELINKSRGTDKPPSMALGENSKDVCKVEQDQLAWRLGKKKELDCCLLSLGPRKQVFAYNLEG